MEKEIIQHIVNALKANTTVEGTGQRARSEQGYESLLIEKKHFSHIKPAPAQLCFIDGGNQEIIATPSLSLQLIRVYAVVFENNKKIKARKQEFFALIKTDEHRQFTIHFFGEYFTELEHLYIGTMDATLRTGNHHVRIAKIGDVVRRYAELVYAAHHAATLKECILVLDGDLKADKTGEQVFLDALYHTAHPNNVSIAALSKSTTLLTEKGNNLGTVVQQISPAGPWLYHPLATITDKTRHTEMSLVKLHPATQSVFRLDTFSKNSFPINKIAAALAANATDPVFIGYPYGLIDADKFARISNRERNYYLTTFMATLGREWKDIAQSLSLQNAHHILDTIS